MTLGQWNIHTQKTELHSYITHKNQLKIGHTPPVGVKTLKFSGKTIGVNLHDLGS